MRSIIGIFLLALGLVLVGCTSQLPSEVTKCKLNSTEFYGVDGDCVATVAAEKHDSSLCERTFNRNSNGVDNCLVKYGTLTNDSSVCTRVSSAGASTYCYQAFNKTPPAGSSMGIIQDVVSAFIKNENTLPPAPTSLPTDAKISFFGVSLGPTPDLSDTQYSTTFAIRDNNGNGKYLNPSGSGTLAIFDQSRKLFETQFPLRSDSYSILAGNIYYSQNLSITKNQIRQLTNARSVTVTVTYVGFGRTLTSSDTLNLN
ncbi:hypothetical protein HY990_02770 [Candidatus Micrarchaeota archaeon]|nr:hypothetical protein [Candidatus Micrarchaeota archaeon]